MATLHQALLPVIHKITDPYFFVAGLLMMGIFIKPKNRPRKKDKMMGTIRSVQDQLQGSMSAREKLERDLQRCRSVSEERDQENSALKKQIKNRSFYTHQLERDLLKKRLHKR